MRVKRAVARGLIADGGGLFLQATNKKAGVGVSRSWVFRFTLRGRAREMGLGPYPAVNLADARRARDESKRLLSQGIDPIQARDEANARAKAEAARSVTFKDAAEAYITRNQSGWRGGQVIAFRR
jgi:hypothetical protein